MKHDYSWAAVAGTELPIYTWIPDDLERPLDTNRKKLNDMRPIQGWYKDSKEKREQYYPLYQKVGEQSDE